MIRTAIHEILAGRNLTPDCMRAVMLQMMEGEATNAQMGAFLAAMRMKGETIEEITACAEVMREKCLRLHPKTDVLDIVGTGGDELFSFNISTVASFVAAAGGVPVAKHGNRSVSSQCGSADVLEALGVNIMLGAAESEAVLEECGICFMMAQVYHAAMKHIAPVRRELGARTIFNILGPLANPAGASLQLLGVYDENLVYPLASVLRNLGVKRAMVVHGSGGLDEITLTGRSVVCEVTEGRINSYFITPEQFGLTRCVMNDLVGGGPEYNAEIARRILSGEQGPRRDIVVLNAACCLYLGQNNTTLRECVRLAQKLIDSGKAMQTLEDLIRVSNEVAQ